MQLHRRDPYARARARAALHDVKMRTSIHARACNASSHEGREDRYRLSARDSDSVAKQRGVIRREIVDAATSPRSNGPR